ncbi:AaceriAGL228Cp [[Ashbya] aceris (nom. inval.)]|nr:AaceriAGL228Cp [[Ashbya] aceris (nom. inval.)]
MHTLSSVRDSVAKFQAEPLHDSRDYVVLQQARRHADRRLAEVRYVAKQMQQLYQQLDKTRNYQEFVDVLMNNRALLREVFTLEKNTARRVATPRVQWSKYGVDVEAYVIERGRSALGAACGWGFEDE